MRDYDSVNQPSLTPFIRTANLVTNRMNTCATAKDYTLDSDLLLEIETWLAAHFYSMSDRPYSTTRTDKAYAKFQGITKMGLEASHYGQTALNLDYSGCLSIINSTTNKSVSVTWLGKPPSEQTDYEDRD